MNFDWITILGIFCVGQCFFLSLLYFFKDKKKSTTSYLIILLLLVFAFDQTHDLLVHSRLILEYPFLVGWASLFTYLKGPLIFFLAKSSLDAAFKFHRFDLLHLGVFVFMNIKNGIQEIAHDIPWKLSFLQDYYYNLDSNLPMSSEATISLSDLWLLHPIAYIFISIVYLYGKRSSVGIYKKKQLFWLRLFTIGYTIVYLVNISFYVFSSYYQSISQFYWGFSSLQFSILIIVLSYANLNPQFYSSLFSKKKGYESSNLTEEDSLQMINMIDLYIKNNKTFLTKRLSLSDLSKLVDISTHQISQVVNEHKSLNFQEYINQFRVEEAKQLIASSFSQDFTFDTIALEIGFNSSTTFYRAFKKFTQQTPKQYLLMIRSQ